MKKFVLKLSLALVLLAGMGSAFALRPVPVRCFIIVPKFCENNEPKPIIDFDKPSIPGLCRLPWTRPCKPSPFPIWKWAEGGEAYLV